MTPQEITTARETLGLSKTAFAQLLQLGINGRSTVLRWERGLMKCRKSKLIEMLVEKHLTTVRNGSSMSSQRGSKPQKKEVKK